MHISRSTANQHQYKNYLKVVTLHAEYRQMDVCGDLQRMRKKHYFPTQFQHVKSMRHLLIDQINFNHFLSK